MNAHSLRVINLVGCGLLLGIISALLIGLTITKVTPQTLGLAERIDAGRTAFFIRTADRNSFARAITVYRPMMPASPLPEPESLPGGISYEFALLSGTGNTQLQWVISVHTDSQRQTIAASTDDPGLLLGIRDIGRSLGRSPALQDGDRSAVNLAFIDPVRLPLADEAVLLARSIISPFESAVITWNGPQGTLVLRKKEKTVFAKSGAAADVLPVSSAPPAMSDVEPLFSIAASDPHTILALFAESPQQQNSQFSEGLKGILRAKLEASAHRTDLATAADDLLSGPTRLLITGNKKDGSTRLTTGELRFVVTGQAKNKQVADQWVNDLRSATIPARIRTQEFFKENSRTDVLADTDATRMRTQSGWTIADIGAGSSRFTVATKGDQIILSNDPVLLSMATRHLDHPTASSTSGPRSLKGTMDIPWLTKATGEWLPFLKPDLSVLTSTLFGPDVRRVYWKATDAANSVVVRFTLLGNSVR